MPQYTVEYRARAQRALLTELPLKIALAAEAFINGPLSENPQRVGKKLGKEFSGLWSARLATYRIIYEIREEQIVIVVVDVRHRAHVYAARRIRG